MRHETELRSDLDDWPQTPDQFAAIGAQHLLPIAYVVRNGKCRLAIIRQRSKRFSFAGSDPIVGIVGDDTDVALGPAGFHCGSVERFLTTCWTIGIVSCSPIVEPYVLAAGVAMLTRKNTAIIETMPAHEAAWEALARQAQPNAQIVLCKVGRR